MSGSIQLDREQVPVPPFRVADSVKAAAEKFRQPYPALVMGVASAMFGPGKVQPEEYFLMRMFGVKQEEVRSFVGRRIAFGHNRTANDLAGWRELMEDKPSVEAMLRGLGFPMPVPLAMYHPTRSAGRLLPTLKTAAEIADLLRDPSNFPLFMKPNTLAWSVGTASLVSTDGTTITDLFGRTAAIEAFSVSIADMGTDGGFLFHRTVQNHPELAAVCGPALATARIFAINGAKGPEIVRAHIKLPAAENIADNTWRSGNLAVHVDLETGGMKTGWVGNGLEAIEHTEHPDTGVSLAINLPGWDDAKTLVLDAMAVFPGLRIVGWDMAFSPDGPVIIEGNSDPDWEVTQRLTGRGMLDVRFAAFLAWCKANPRTTRN